MTHGDDPMLGVTPLPREPGRVSMDDLKQLALDIFEGQVFTSFSLPEAAMTLLPMIFLPLALMKPEDRQKLIADKISFFYEYLNKAGPQAVNGYPIFMSVRYLLPDEEDILIEYMRDINAALDKFMRTTPTPRPDPTIPPA